jgi:hypothetical protein
MFIVRQGVELTTKLTNQGTSLGSSPYGVTKRQLRFFGGILFSLFRIGQDMNVDDGRKRSVSSRQSALMHAPCILRMLPLHVSTLKL